MLVTAAMLKFAPGLSAGEIGRIPRILNNIEKCEQEENWQELSGLLDSLWNPAVDFVRDYERFGADDFLQQFVNSTDSERVDVFRTLVPLLQVKDKFIWNKVVAGLAFYKYPPAEQMLADYPDSPVKAVLYAILGYRRAYRWAIDRLSELDREPVAENSEMMTERMAYLNLLYWLAEPGSLPFVNELIKLEKNEIIKSAAERVRDRIYSLHPETE